MTDAEPTPAPRARSLALAALLLLTLVRLMVAATLPLSPDEAYYWVWSRALAPGYLDHPPMVALWIGLGTAIAGSGAVGIRLLAPLSACAGSLLVADAGRALFPGRGAGTRATILFNATLMAGAGAVTMTPDTPLLFFWTAATWAAARIAAGGDGAWWLAVGAAAGCALDSKYTAALLGLGIAAWLLTPAMRRHLWTPWPWAGGLLAAALFAPVILWNADHGWASFARQGGRTGDWAPSQALRTVAELLGGQLGLATPILAILFAAAVAHAARRWRDPAWALLAALVLPGAAVFLQHALGDRVQANWVAPLYPAAALAAGAVGNRWWRPASALGATLTAAVYLQATLAPLRLPRALDPTLRLAGYPALANEAAPDAAFLAAEEYGLAAELALASPGVPVVAAGRRWRLFDLPGVHLPQPGVLVLGARRAAPDPALWAAAEPLRTLVRNRGGVPVETIRLYRVTPRDDAPLVLLPRP